MRSKNDHDVYCKHAKDEKLLVGVYVDDLIITGSNHERIKGFKAAMERSFEMDGLGFGVHTLVLRLNSIICAYDQAKEHMLRIPWIYSK